MEPEGPGFTKKLGEGVLKRRGGTYKPRQGRGESRELGLVTQEGRLQKALLGVDYRDGAGR